MDLLRSCYRSEQRLCSDDSTILTAGEWHFCLPAAKILPIAHAFGSANWDPWFVTQDYPLGEAKGRLGYAKGKPDPRQPGDHYCGSSSAWLEGIPAAARPGLGLGPEGIPLCCLPAAQQGQIARGTLAIGGQVKVLPALTGGLDLVSAADSLAHVAGGLGLAGGTDSLAAIAGGLGLTGGADSMAAVAGGIDLAGGADSMAAVAGGLGLTGGTESMAAIAGALALGGDTGPFVGPPIALRVTLSSDSVTANYWYLPDVGADTFRITVEALNAIGEVDTGYDGPPMIAVYLFDQFGLIDPANPYFTPVLTINAGVGSVDAQWVFFGFQGPTNKEIGFQDSVSFIVGSTTQTVSMLP